ncbi:MAG: ABC transporter ATP-binding protein [Coriobacteriia bacterium]
MIRLENVTKRFGEKTAVDGLTLEVPEGEVCVLIGPSGCGKTTTLRMVNRLIEPTSGRIMVNGRDVMSMRPEELRRGLGYVIQSIGLFPHLTVAENIAVVPRLLDWDKARIATRASELLSLVGLEPDAYLAKYPRQLSGGEAQRVGVARALAADPPVLLMDEPFGAVDPLNRERLQAEFGRIQRELHKTVMFVTHDIDEAIRLADRVAIMRDGRLQQYDTPENVLNRPANKFVHDFVGADRALKRLVRIKVTEVMRQAPQAAIDDEPAAIQERAGSGRFVYLTDDSGRLAGWLDTADIRDGAVADAITSIDRAQAAVVQDASLRDALSRMLGLGFRSIAVTDDDGRIVGEVTFASIEAVMAEAEEHRGPTAEGEGA